MKLVLEIQSCIYLRSLVCRPQELEGNYAHFMENCHLINAVFVQKHLVQLTKAVLKDIIKNRDSFTFRLFLTNFAIKKIENFL